MKVTALECSTAGQRPFLLEAETDADKNLISAIDHHRPHIAIASTVRDPVKRDGGWEVIGAVIELGPNSRQALAAQAGRECLSGVRELLSLARVEAPGNGAVVADTANPKAHK